MLLRPLPKIASESRSHSKLHKRERMGPPDGAYGGEQVEEGRGMGHSAKKGIPAALTESPRSHTLSQGEGLLTGLGNKCFASKVHTCLRCVFETYSSMVTNDISHSWNMLMTCS